MTKQVRVCVELSGGDVATVPQWVKTEEDLEDFVDEYANNNISVSYEFLDEDISIDEFLKK